MKKLFSILLIIGVLISVCSCTFNKNVDESLIETSNGILGTWTFEEGRTFSVVVDDNNIYHVDINGTEKLVEIEEKDIVENTKSNISECDLEVMEIVKASKNKVVDYINNSKILKDKEALVEHINNVVVKMADFSIDEAAEYDSELNSIFINNKNRADVCEWMIIHELVHALYTKTNEGVENSKYQNTLFNEVLTDLITAEMEPEIIFEMESKYFSYYLWMYNYLGCVDFDGIEAYFYGYDKVLERIPEAELDVFVESLENENESEDAVVILTNCINDWGLENKS